MTATTGQTPDLPDDLQELAFSSAVSSRRASPDYPMEDLIQIAVLGMIGRGVTRATDKALAVCIGRRAIVDAVAGDHSGVRVSLETHRKYLAFADAERRLVHAIGHAPTAEEVCDYMGLEGVRRKRRLILVRLVRASSDPADLSALACRDGDAPRRCEDRDTVRKALGSLTTRQRAAVVRLYGLDGERPERPFQIAARTRRHRTAVASLHDAALKRMRRAMGVAA